jgi:hypothetical protein
MKWKIASASVAGTSHHSASKSCEDCHTTRVVTGLSESEILVAIATDGAGSAAHGGIGARLICEVICTHFQDKLKTADLGQLGLEDIKEAVSAARASLYRESDVLNVEPRELAATMVVAVVGSQVAHFIQIGDGAIVIDQDDGYSAVFWPDAGEYANMTRFVSDADAFEHLHYDVRNAPDEISLFTDGIQRLALVFSTKCAHSPFFAPMFAQLRSASTDALESLSKKLAGFLDSDVVNQRTDDDKTLILATRRASEDL